MMMITQMISPASIVAPIAIYHTVGDLSIASMPSHISGGMESAASMLGGRWVGLPPMWSPLGEVDTGTCQDGPVGV